MQVQSLLTRPGGTKVEIGGKEYHFEKNEQGEEVCEVSDAYALHRLVNEIPLGFRLHGADAGKKVERPAKEAAHVAHPLNKTPVSKKSTEPEHMVITKPDGEQIDLMELDRDALAAILQGEFGTEVHAKWKVDAIRNKIVEAIRVANTDE